MPPVALGTPPFDPAVWLTLRSLSRNLSNGHNQEVCNENTNLGVRVKERWLMSLTLKFHRGDIKPPKFSVSTCPSWFRVHGASHEISTHQSDAVLTSWSCRPILCERSPPRKNMIGNLPKHIGHLIRACTNSSRFSISFIVSRKPPPVPV